MSMPVHFIFHRQLPLVYCLSRCQRIIELRILERRVGLYENRKGIGLIVSLNDEGYIPFEERQLT